LSKYKPGDKKWNEFADELGRFGSKFKWAVDVTDHKCFRGGAGHPDPEKLATMYTVVNTVGSKQVDELIGELLPAFGNYADMARALGLLKNIKAVANRYLVPETPAALVRGEDFIDLLASAEDGPPAFKLLQKLSVCDSGPRYVCKIRSSMEKQGEINMEKTRKAKEAEKSAKEKEAEAANNRPGSGGQAPGAAPQNRPPSSGTSATTSSKGRKKASGHSDEEDAEGGEKRSGELPSVIPEEVLEDLGLKGDEESRYPTEYTSRFDKVADIFNFVVDDFERFDKLLDLGWAAERVFGADGLPTISEFCETLVLTQSAGAITIQSFARTAADILEGDLEQVGQLLSVFLSLLKAFNPKQLETLSSIMNDLGGYDKMVAMTKDLASLKMRLRRGQEFPQFVRCVTDFFGGSGNIMVGMDILAQRDKRGYKSFDFVELCTIMQHIAPRASDLPAVVAFIDDLQKWEHALNDETTLLKQVGAPGKTCGELKKKKMQSFGILESLKAAKEAAQQSMEQNSSRGGSKKLRLGDMNSAGGGSTSVLSDDGDGEGGDEVFIAARGVWPIEKESAIRNLMAKMKESGCNLEKLARVLQIMSDCGGADESLEIFELTQPLMKARDHMPKTKEERDIFPAVMKAMVEDSGLGFVKMGQWLTKVPAVHWPNMFIVAEEVLLHTTCGNLRELSDLHFSFFQKHVGDLHYAFQGRSENLKNCLSLLNSCGLIGKRNFKFATNDPVEHSNLLGDSRREYSPLKSRLGPAPPVDMADAWRAKSREGEMFMSPSGGGTRMFGRESWNKDASSSSPNPKYANLASPFSHMSSPGKNMMPEFPPGFDEESLAEDTWKDWFKLIKKVKAFRGAAFFLKCLDGCDVTEFLLAVDALKAAQVISADQVIVPQPDKQSKAEKKFFEKNGTATEIKPAEFASNVAMLSSGKALVPPRSAAEMSDADGVLSAEAQKTLTAKAFYKFTPLKAFLKVLVENGGLEVFLWLVRGVDLTKIQTQLFSMSLLRASPLFRQMLDDERYRGTLVRLVHACEEVGTIERAVAKLESNKVSLTDNAFGTGSQNTSALTSQDHSSSTNSQFGAINEKFAQEAGKIVCRGLNLIYADVRDEQTIYALVDFWRTVFFSNQNAKGSDSDEDDEPGALTAGAKALTERIPLEELDLLKNFLVSLREYLHVAVSKYENLGDLTQWIKFIKKTDDRRFLAKLERLLEWPGRSFKQGLEMWLGYRTRFSAARLEDWRTMGDRMGAFCDAKTKDLSVIMHILAAHAHASMLARSPKHRAADNNFLATFSGSERPYSSTSTESPTSKNTTSVSWHAQPVGSNLHRPPAAPHLQQSASTTSAGAASGVIAGSGAATSSTSTSSTHPLQPGVPGDHASGQDTSLLSNSLMFSSIAEGSVSPRPKLLPGVDEPTFHRHAAELYDLFPGYSKKKAHSASLSSSSWRSNKSQNANQKFLLSQASVDLPGSLSSAMGGAGAAGASRPANAQQSQFSQSATNFNVVPSMGTSGSSSAAHIMNSTSMSAGPGMAMAGIGGAVLGRGGSSIVAENNVLKIGAAGSSKRGTRPAKKQAWQGGANSQFKPNRSQASSFLGNSISLNESTMSRGSAPPPPPSLFATSVHAGQILSPLEAEQLSQIRRNAPTIEPEEGRKANERVRNIILL